MCLRWGLLDGKNSESLPDELHYASCCMQCASFPGFTYEPKYGSQGTAL